MIHPIGGKVNPAAIAAQLDPLFDHLFSIDFELDFALGFLDGRGLFIRF